MSKTSSVLSSILGGFIASLARKPEPAKANDVGDNAEFLKASRPADAGMGPTNDGFGGATPGVEPTPAPASFGPNIFPPKYESIPVPMAVPKSSPCNNDPRPEPTAPAVNALIPNVGASAEPPNPNNSGKAIITPLNQPKPASLLLIF